MRLLMTRLLRDHCGVPCLIHLPHRPQLQHPNQNRNQSRRKTISTTHTAGSGGHLVGTIIQAEQSLAIVADATGEFDVKGIGESLELSPQGITVEQLNRSE